MLPTDEQMLKEIRAISVLAPHLMQCYNCKHYDRATSECEVNHFKMAPFVRGCNGKYFLTREEEMLYKARKTYSRGLKDYLSTYEVGEIREYHEVFDWHNLRSVASRMSRDYGCLLSFAQQKGKRFIVRIL